MRQRWWLSLVLLGVLILTVGCTGQMQALMGPPHNPLETLGMPGGKLPAPRLRIQPLAQGDETPYTPVMMPPDVRRAFVRGHINAHRDLIAGHWWYVRIRDWSWPVELERTAPAVDAPLLTPLAPRPPAKKAPPPSSGASSTDSPPTVGALMNRIKPASAGTPISVMPHVLPQGLINPDPRNLTNSPAPTRKGGTP